MLHNFVTPTNHSPPFNTTHAKLINLNESSNNSVVNDLESQSQQSNSVFSSPNPRTSTNRFIFLKKIISMNNKRKKAADDSLTSPTNSYTFYSQFKKHQRIAYLILEQPMGSTMGRILMGLFILATMINVFEAVFLSSRQLAPLPLPQLIVDSLLLSIFLLEFTMRLISITAFSRKYPQAVLQPLFLVDLTSIVSLFIAVLSPHNDLYRILQAWNLITFMKTLSVLKILRYIDKSYIFARGLKQSTGSLGFLALMIIIANFVFATMIYYAEILNPASKLSRGIPTALWYSIVTMTTVGYGDVVPLTPLGKVIGGMIGIFGMIMLALPVVILGYHFQEVYNQIQEEEFMDELKTKELADNTKLTDNEKETHYLKIRIDNVESCNRDIMNLLEDSEQVYRDVSGDLKTLYSSIYTRKRRSSFREIDTMGYNIKVMKKIQRPVRKVQLTEIFKDGFRRLRSLSESDVDGTAKTRQQKIMQRAGNKHSTSVDKTRKLLRNFEKEEDDDGLRDSVSIDSDSKGNINDSGDVSSDSDEYVSKPSTSFSKPSLLFLDRLKTLEHGKRRRSLYSTTIEKSVTTQIEHDRYSFNKSLRTPKKLMTMAHGRSHIGLLDYTYEKRSSVFSNSPGTSFHNKHDYGDNSPYLSLASLKNNSRRSSLRFNDVSRQKFQRPVKTREHSLSIVQFDSQEFDGKSICDSGGEPYGRHKKAF